MNRSLRYVKFLIVTILIGLFAWNSLYLFKYFIVGKKVTSYEDKNNPVLIPPAIFVCRKIAFTKAKDMAKLDDFLENTTHDMKSFLQETLSAVQSGIVNLKQPQKGAGAPEPPTTATPGPRPWPPSSARAIQGDASWKETQPAS